VTVSTRSYFSKHYLSSSKFFAAQAKAIEVANTGKPQFSHEHRAYVLGSVTSSVMFLEALINELFSDAADGHLNGAMNKFASTELERLKLLWDFGVPRTARYSITYKFTICLKALSRPAMEISKAPQNGIKLLVQLRNALTHYEPETVTSVASIAAGAKGGHKFDALQTLFPDNTLVASGNAYFPDKCLGAGCAAWSRTVAIAYADEFYSRLDHPPPYAP